MSGVHARLSASAAPRWMNCPGSVKLSQGLPNPSRVDSAFGTFAHSIAADCLQNSKPLKIWKGVKQNVEGFDFTVDDAMIEGIKVYLDSCYDDFEPGDTTWVEVDLTPYLSKLHPSLGGTADHVRYRPSTKQLHVKDLKFGAGNIVEVEDNKQLLIYALGVLLALLSLSPGSEVHEVKVTICQPRAEHVDGRERSWTFPAVQIMDFAADVMDAARATEAPDAPIIAGKAQCKWCLAVRICPEAEKRQHAIIAAQFDNVTSYDPDKLRAALDAIPMVEARIKAIREFAYAEAEKGNPVPGYKLVQKRASRYWVSEANAIEWAQANGFDPYHPRELKSPAQLEEMIPGGRKKEERERKAVTLAGLKALVDSRSSGLTLVSNDDERPPAKRITAEDFAVIDGTANKIGCTSPVANLL